MSKKNKNKGNTGARRASTIQSKMRGYTQSGNNFKDAHKINEKNKNKKKANMKTT